MTLRSIEVTISLCHYVEAGTRFLNDTKIAGQSPSEPLAEMLRSTGGSAPLQKPPLAC